MPSRMLGGGVEWLYLKNRGFGEEKRWAGTEEEEGEAWDFVGLCCTKKRERERQTLSFPILYVDGTTLRIIGFFSFPFVAFFMLDVVPIVVDVARTTDRQNVHDRSTATALDFGLSDADERTTPHCNMHTYSRKESNDWCSGTSNNRIMATLCHIHQSPISPAFVFHVEWRVWGYQQKSTTQRSSYRWNLGKYIDIK